MNACVRGFALLGCLSAAVRAGSETPLETVPFEIDHVTAPGDSVFLLGDITELGGGDLRRAVKLVPGAYDPGPPASLVWRLDVAIPQGITWSHSFVVRDDAVSAYSDPLNGTSIAGPLPGATAAPLPPRTTLRFYRWAGQAVPDVTYLTAAGAVPVEFEALAHEPDWLLAPLPDQPFGPGLHATFNGKDVATPLHALVRWGAHVYNYVPDLGASRDGLRETHAVPTQGLIPATRNVGGTVGRGIEVWLPRGYATETDRRYPVLYMHDGQNVFLPGGPFGSWAAEVVADRAIRDGRVRELIIVGIDNSSNRLAEYNPDWSNSDNADYNEFIVSVLKPWVDARFRTLPGRDDTGICGSSFGGVASLSAVVSHPQVFGRVAAMSTSFWATDVQDQITAQVPATTRLYIDAGDTSDGADATIAVRDELLADGRVLHGNLFFELGFGQQHNEAAWSARLPFALEALFPVSDEPAALDLPVLRPGDADASGCVDLDDLLVVLVAFGRCEADPGFVPAHDLDRSGCIDLGDLLLVLGDFGGGCP